RWLRCQRGRKISARLRHLRTARMRGPGLTRARVWVQLSVRRLAPIEALGNTYAKTGMDGSTFAIRVVETSEGLLWVYAVDGRMTIRKVNRVPRAEYGWVEAAVEPVLV